MRWWVAAVLAGAACGKSTDTGAALDTAAVLALAVEITPEQPTTVDALAASVSGADAVSWTWERDGEVVAELDGAEVAADRTAKGERWRAVAAAGASEASAEVTILNTPPPAPSVAIAPLAPVEGVDTLSCAVGELAEDIDGDVVSWSWRWEVDGEAWEGGDPVPPEALHPGASWVCVGTATDGEASVDARSAEVVVVPFDVGASDPWVEPELWVEPFSPVVGSTAVVVYQGELAGESALDLLVGYDGWSEVSATGAPVTWLTVAGNAMFGHRLAMSQREPGVWEVEVDVPAGVGALHLTVQSADGALVDDRGGLEHHWGVRFPYIGPFLTWTDAARPTDGVMVTFESSVPSLGVVAYREEGGATRYAIGEALDTLHQVPLLGLAPDTAYTYEVLDATGRVSETYAFRTLPEDLAALDLIVVADMQDADVASEDRWPEIADAAWAAVPDARAVIAPGDLAANDEPGFWWRFFDGGRALMASVPVVPAIGNHDTPGKESDPDSTSYTRYFELPLGSSGSEEYYAVDVGPLRVLSLSTEVPDQLQPGGVQYTWVEEQRAALLAEAEPPTWVFVQYHKPPYDIGTRFYADNEIYRAVTVLFDGVVDWVLTGHEHIYQRTLPVQFEGILAGTGGYGVGPEDGTGYVVLPTAGNRAYDGVVSPTLPDWDLVAYPAPPVGPPVVEEEHGFVEVRLDGRRLTLRSWGMGTGAAPAAPWVRDEVSYDKP